MTVVYEKEMTFVEDDRQMSIRIPNEIKVMFGIEKGMKAIMKVSVVGEKKYLLITI